ncbi:MAG: Glucodextranase, domain [Bacteroidota bacterium]|jgi:hypothetical protein
MKNYTYQIALFAIMSLFFKLSTTAQPLYEQVAVYDNYAETTNNWPTGSDQQKESFIGAGKYFYQNKNRSQGIILNRNFELDFNRDFQIETQILLTQGESSIGIALGGGLDTSDYMLQIAPQSQEAYLRYTKNGERNVVVDWKKLLYLKSEKTPNNLKIKKTGEKISFTINGIETANIPFVAPSSRRVGLYCGSGTTLETYLFKITYLQTNPVPQQDVVYTNTDDIRIDLREPDLQRGFKVAETEEVTVAGFVNSDQKITEVLVNNQAAFLGDDGYFSVKIPMSKLQTQIVILATDAQYRKARKIIDLGTSK